MEDHPCVAPGDLSSYLERDWWPCFLIARAGSRPARHAFNTDPKGYVVCCLFASGALPSQYVATQCGVVYELGERRETDLVGQVR